MKGKEELLQKKTTIHLGVTSHVSTYSAHQVTVSNILLESCCIQSSDTN